MSFWHCLFARFRKQKHYISIGNLQDPSDFGFNCQFSFPSQHRVSLNPLLSHSENSGIGMRIYQPKCLPQVNYGELIQGSVEDFSNECWLENHLHRFGVLRGSVERHSRERTHSNQIMNPEEQTLSMISAESITDEDSGSDVADFDNLANEQIENLMTECPPPYSDEPPPSYEEALASATRFEYNPD